MQKETKKWFEANYLDGDKIQDGQMLSSRECFNALLQREKEILEGVKETIMQLGRLPAKESWKGGFKNTDEVLAYNQALSDLSSHIQNKIDKLNK